ncbi:MAG: imidazole glycerol phosphate synthase subunit HisH [Alphaproteobacteria bacterium]|nr:imidazole glycerol phosphate synthase subunit HisH [Alphaproteobacteria bacterium]MCA0451269.1 imidazole glycerol phosphate synthase subunit HisH [Pseudomonadota bacterium]
MKIAVVDYGSGNLRSAAKAFEHEAKGRAEIVVTSDADIVRKADRIVLPGQGAFGDCAAGLRAVPGMVDALNDAVVKRGAPFLGICVGMQLLAATGYEHGVHEGLGWLGGEVRRMEPQDPALKLPQLGWNALDFADHPLLKGWPKGTHVYFANSYHFTPADKANVIATADYGGPIVAAVAKGNIAGTQFHPEKSQAIGLALVSNFLEWRP